MVALEKTGDLEMQHQILTITEQARFSELLENYYKNSKIIVKLTNDTVQAEYLGNNNGMAAFKVHSVKNLPKDCLIIAKKGSELVYGSMKQLEQQEDQLFIFQPLRFQIISSARREERINVQQGQGKQIIFITNMISNVLIDNDMVMEKKKNRQDPRAYHRRA